jgi:hypothetical protein
MTWTTPTVRTTGDLITASIYKTEIVDNLIALKALLLNGNRQATAVTTVAASPLVGCTAAGISITLPSSMASVAGTVVVVKDESGGAAASPITIGTEAGATIDGAATESINSNYGALGFWSNGTNWFVFSTFGGR